MKRTDCFEGYYDPDCGWEFDMPIVMIHPILREGYGGNTGEIESLIEDYQIDFSLHEESPNQNKSPKDEEPENKKQIMGMFKRAKKRFKEGKQNKGARYWKCVIEWDTDENKASEQKIIERVGF